MDDLFTHIAQRRAFREYLAGVLAPRERNKTLTWRCGRATGSGPGPPTRTPLPMRPASCAGAARMIQVTGRR